jgi:hypothetical protein
MKASLARIMLVVFLALLGASVFNVAFVTPLLFPIVLFSVAVSLSLTRGFVRALPAVIVIGLVCDVASLGRIGILAAFCAGLTYTVSFFSRRFSVEHGLSMHLFAGMVVGAGALAFLYMAPWFDGTPQWPVSGSEIHWGMIMGSFAAGILSFPVISAVLRRFEEWLSYFDFPNAF